MGEKQGNYYDDGHDEKDDLYGDDSVPSTRNVNDYYVVVLLVTKIVCEQANVAVSDCEGVSFN
eukprot:scaffold531565_cov55-Attheya_sp.AAC.1